MIDELINQIRKLKRKRKSKSKKRKLDELYIESGEQIIKKFKITNELSEDEAEVVVEYLNEVEEDFCKTYKMDISVLNSYEKYKLLINYKIITDSNFVLNSNSLVDMLSSDLNIKSKSYILDRIREMKQTGNKKMGKWINTISKIPFGKYQGDSLPDKSNKLQVRKLLNKIRGNLDNKIYGQTKAKDGLIELVASWITNPKTRGRALGLVGEAGVGKTSLIKEGLSKGLNRAYCSMSLSGINDDSYLSGHAITYEGSKSGKIVDMLIEAGSMNPIIFMDELDKVSDSKGGRAIVSKLIEIIDYTQNDEYEDLYLSGVKVDLSRCIFIFSLNDINKVDPILRDRIEFIECDKFNKSQKCIITKDYLIKSELKELLLDEKDIIFSESVISYIVDNYSRNAGVRDIKTTINIIVRKLNTKQYLEDIEYPIKITVKLLREILPINKIEDKLRFMYI